MNKRIERLVATALFVLIAAIVWSQLGAHVRAQTSIPGPGSTTDGTQVVKGIPAPCASAPLTKLYQTTASRRSMTVSLGATYTWAVVTNLDTAKQVGIRLNASDTDPYVIPSGASMPTIYPAAGVANLYVDTSTTPTSGGSTTYLSIYACP